MHGSLVVISGPSGVGKTVITDRLLTLEPNLRRLITATTRLPRGGEVDGIHYYFMNRASFLLKEKSGGFLETANVFGNLYGSPLEQVEEITKNRKRKKQDP